MNLRQVCFLATVLISLASAGVTKALDFTTVEGGGGVPLSVVQTGNPSGQDILFIHGFSQSYLAWQSQLDSPLANDFRLTAFDLRGHGASGKPFAPESYQSSRLWADDVASVINGMELRQPVLVGWSWAGFVIMNYVRHHGIGNIRAINLVSANTSLQGPVPPPPPEPGQNTTWMGQMMSADIADNLAGTTASIDLLTSKPLTNYRRQAMIVSIMMTPPYVRQAMLGYPEDNSDLVTVLDLPILVSHGTEDLIVGYGGGSSIVEVLPRASLSTYDGIGHSPFIEDSDRFNRELADFVKGAQ